MPTRSYDSQALRDKLGELGIEDRIAYKAKRNKPLVNWQVWFNKMASRIRLGVERANATMKNWYGMAKVHPQCQDDPAMSQNAG